MKRILVVMTAILVTSVLAAGASGLGSSDASSPALAVTQPVGGSTVSGTSVMSADSSDNAAVVGVQFKVDGVNLGTEDLAAPYALNWDSSSVPNGSHVVTAVARDANGNGASVNVTVDVSNAAAPPPPPPPPPPAGITIRKVFEGSDTDRQVHYFSLTSGVPAGHTILLTHASTIDSTDGTGGIVTPNGVSDTRGNAWSQDAVSHPGNSFTTVEVWGAYVSTALQAGDQIRVNGYSRGLSSVVAIFDVTGLTGTSGSQRVDKKGGSSGYGSTQSSPYVATAQSHELLLGIHGQSSASSGWWTAEAQTPAWTEYVDRFDAGNIGRGLAVVMREVSAAGSYRSRGAVKQSVTGNNLVVAYRAN